METVAAMEERRNILRETNLQLHFSVVILLWSLLAAFFLRVLRKGAAQAQAQATTGLRVPSQY